MEAVSVVSIACFLVVIVLLVAVLLGSVVYVIRFVYVHDTYLFYQKNSQHLFKYKISNMDFDCVL